MTNVIPLPTRQADPLIIRDTVTDLLREDRLPKHGDYIFTVRYGTHVLVSVPEDGFVASVVCGPTADAIRIKFRSGLTITARGDTTIAWYPTPT